MTTLPFWPTLRAAYSFTFRDLERLTSIAGLWLIVFVAIGIGSLWRAETGPVGDGEHLVAALAQFAAIAGFAVAWNRAVLNNEFWALRFGMRELRFLVHGLVIMFGMIAVLRHGGMLLLLLLTAGILASGAYPVPWERMLIFQIAATIILLGPFSGLLLALPAVAQDEQSAVFSAAWRRSRGSRLLIFYGTILAIAPFEVLEMIKQAFLGEPLLPAYAYDGNVPVSQASAAARYLAEAADGAIYFLGTAVAIAFLSSAYRRLAGEAPPLRSTTAARPGT